MPPGVTVVIAEDHQLLRELLETQLDLSPVVTVLGVVADGRSAVAASLSLRPDVVVLDIGMPERSGIETAEDLRAYGWTGPILFLTAYSDPFTIAAAARAGADGFVVKTAGLSALVDAIQTVAAGGTYVSSEAQAAWREAEQGVVLDAGQLARRAAQGDPEALRAAASPVVAPKLLDRAEAGIAASLRPRFASLSPRESTVLAHLVQGHSADLIAELETVSLATVRTQIRAILGKLGVHSQLAAVALARRANWPGDLTLHELDPDEIMGHGTWVRDPAPGRSSDAAGSAETTQAARTSS